SRQRHRRYSGSYTGSNKAACGPPFSFRLRSIPKGRGVMRIVFLAACLLLVPAAHADERPRAREAGIVIGTLPTGPRNAIVDVPGGAIGHPTVIEGDDIRTGVTAILPHGGDLYAERVPAAIHVANGYGKLLGITQVQELGELETPILLTGTLSVWN